MSEDYHFYRRFGSFSICFVFVVILILANIIAATISLLLSILSPYVFSFSCPNKITESISYALPLRRSAFNGFVVFQQIVCRPRLTGRAAQSRLIFQVNVFRQQQGKPRSNFMLVKLGGGRFLANHFSSNLFFFPVPQENFRIL